MTEPSVIQVSTGASYGELREAQDRINAELAKISAEARAKALADIVASIKEFGFTAEELNDAVIGKRKPGRKPGVKLDKADKPKREGKKAAPKYRDPNTGATWTGRGIAPLWIRDVAKEDRDQFLIAQEATSAGEQATEQADAQAEAYTAPMEAASEDQADSMTDTVAEPTRPIFAS